MVISVGTLKHECCLFIRKHEKKYDFLFFNPNQGKTCTKADQLMKTISPSDFRNHFAIFPQKNNIKGHCSGIVYNEIYKFITNPKYNPYNISNKYKQSRPNKKSFQCNNPFFFFFNKMDFVFIFIFVNFSDFYGKFLLKYFRD